MQEAKPRTVNSLGMFDLFKGIGMLVVVLVHTAELYQIDAGGLSYTTFLPFIYREAMMSAFYIASGYGFRKRSFGKCVKQQLKGILPPFLYTAAATSLLHLFLHRYFFGSWQAAAVETGRVLFGFLFGLPHTATYFGISLFSCGPMWYLLAMAVGWIILDLIMNAFSEQYVPWAVVATATLGWATCLVWELPFCLSQGMTVVPYLYIGHIAKKKRWFEKPLSGRFHVLLIACLVISAIAAVVTGATDNMSMGYWNLGPFGIIINGVLGLWITSFFLGLSRRWDNRLTRALQGIGRRSLYIFCVHTVELIAVPWYLFAALFTSHPLTGLLLQFSIRSAFIAAICALLEARRRRLPVKAKKPKQPKRSPARTEQHYAARH